MKYPSYFLLAFFVYVVVRAAAGGLDADEMTAICVLGMAYVIGGTHGLYLGWSHQRRMDAWAARFCDKWEALQAKEEVGSS